MMITMKNFRLLVTIVLFVNPLQRCQGADLEMIGPLSDYATILIARSKFFLQKIELLLQEMEKLENNNQNGQNNDQISAIRERLQQLREAARGCTATAQLARDRCYKMMFVPPTEYLNVRVTIYDDKALRISLR